MYRVLYRKYRPSAFADVWGQPQVTDILKKQIKTGRLSHAYLFTGSRGIGKTTCAKILAKAVNCLHPVDGDPCNQCEICRGIDDETIHEVVEMDAASNNGVGDVRDLQERLAFPPTQCKYRVYIIDEVHMMTGNAFNALLKTLEEPPPNVLFILATTEVHEIPATIISRCQRMDFKRISAEDIAGRLEEIALSESSDIEHNAGLLIGRLSDGGMRDAVSLLDQCLARSREVTEDIVRETAGLAGHEHLVALSRAINAGDGASVMTQLGELYAMSKDMLRLCEELVSYYRSLMIINSVSKPEELIIVTGEQLNELREDAKTYSLSRIMLLIDRLQEALEHMSRGANRRTELELALLKCCRIEDNTQQKNAAIPSNVEQRLSALERAVKSGGTIRREKPAATPPVASSAIIELSDKAVAYDRWNEIMAELEKTSTPLFSVLNGAKGYTSDRYMLIETTEMGADLMRQPTSREILKKIILDKTGIDYKIGPYRPSSSSGESKQADISQELLERLERSGVTVNKED